MKLKMFFEIRYEYKLVIAYFILFTTTINPPDVQNQIKRSLIESDGQWKILGFIQLEEMSLQVELAQQYLEIFRKFCALATKVTSTLPSGCRKTQDLMLRISQLEQNSKKFRQMATAVDYINKILQSEEYDEVIDGVRVTFLDNPGDAYSKSMEHIRNIQEECMTQHIRVNNLITNIQYEKFLEDAEYRTRIIRKIDELSIIDMFSITEAINRFEAVQDNLLSVCAKQTLTPVNQFLSKHDLMYVLKLVEKTLKEETCNYGKLGSKLILPFNTNTTDYNSILDAISINCYAFGARLSFEITIPLMVVEKYSLYHTNLNTF